MARRLAAYHGQQGPVILVQLLVEQDNITWKRRALSVWYAEKGGDDKKAVFRVNVPARPAYRKCSRVSVQYHLRHQSLLIQTVKQNLMEYAVQWVTTFGPAAHAGSSAPASADLQALLNQRGGPPEAVVP